MLGTVTERVVGTGLTIPATGLRFGGRPGRLLLKKKKKKKKRMNKLKHETLNGNREQ